MSSMEAAILKFIGTSIPTFIKTTVRRRGGGGGDGFNQTGPIYAVYHNDLLFDGSKKYILNIFA